ncbi:MAG: COP23 domain-containing protein [Xenococcus sp. (in: cyanobacteria)]
MNIKKPFLLLIASIASLMYKVKQGNKIMNFRFLVSLILVISSLNLVAESTESQPTNQDSLDRVTFFCGETIEANSGDKLPTTLAWVPQRGKNVPIIYWKSYPFRGAKWTNQKRCDSVSPKFQTFYENNLLGYLTHGISRQGYPVICAVVTDTEQCNTDNQLFQLKPDQQGGEVLRSLMDIFESRTAQPLYQSSGKQVYVPMNNFLEEAPAVDLDDTIQN